MAKYKVVGINFDHFHMGDLLRHAYDHPEVELVGICDLQPERMLDAVKAFSLSEDAVFTDYQKCLETTQPDLAILCPAAAEHGEWVEKVAPFGCDIMVEKPFAATLAEADRMIAAMNASGRRLAINWPLAWMPSHCTAKRLIDEGQIGDVIEVHHYGGNRGPLWHVADKIERTKEQVDKEKPNSWFYKASAGGGSLLDYAGYGTTLATWYMNGRKPIEVTCVVDQPVGLEVDEHSIIICRYESGLSKMETRWGTFTDPWTHQPQPKCGFVIVGTDGTISSLDYGKTINIQTRDCPEGKPVPSDVLQAPRQDPVQYMVNLFNEERDVEGILSTKISRIGQQIVDSAVRSANEKRTVSLLN
ncbi:Glucose--fructose oxidoreductase precursor [Novipirellula aureliae]|uniref:Glucose--fructose oxidoreductase n=1 Tax=Novipirellula aureliae TaxID=2527966 RepID=A0A5C6DPV5_9BACT|nr:Gfo/Idh/MocA family oxidoreductase [Novipirellula aureliae]TWU38778.1 Glucose--fructose oxidoreductase precursor [Novipirellula aureliae]